MNDLSPELLAQVHAFRSEHIDPHVAGWEREHRMGLEAMPAAAALGLTALEVPEELGGLGLDFLGKLAVIDVLSETAMGFAFSVVNTANVAARIAREGTSEQQDRYLADLIAGRRLGSTALTEPGAGSDFSSISTRATAVDGGWVINGAKAWITNAAVSDVMACYVQTDPAAGANGIACVLIDGTREGFERVEPYHIGGCAGFGTGGFRLVDYEASESDLFYPAGQAFKAALGSINGARTYVAAMCCAMVRNGLTTAVRYGAERQTFGQPIINHQGLAWSLADVANKLEAATLLTRSAAEAVNASTSDRSEAKRAILAAAHAKKFATEMVEPALSACIQAMGAEGLHEHHPLMRQRAAARIANYVDGSTEIQTDRIAGSLLAVYG